MGSAGECHTRLVLLDRKEAWTIMRLERDDNEERGPTALDLRLVARLRRIANAGAHLHAGRYC